MDTQLYCPNETRKQLVRAAGTLNGIDFLEVLDDDAPDGSPRQRTLLLHCLRPVPGLSERNVTIAGGVRVRAVGVEWARPANAVPAGLLGASEVAYLALLPQPERILVVRTDRAGDFSPYTLRLVLSPTRTDSPPPGFDDLLATVEFSFKVDCPSDFDCDPPRPALPPPPEVSRVDYLARDFASFRRLMLDRMAASMPAWKERNPADLGIALVETLAYAADHLSYFQDAVATEAYLGTARRRASVRRHARLVDYFMHDGANARAWIAVEVTPGGAADGATLPGPRSQPPRRPGTLILSRESGAVPVLTPEQGELAIAGGPWPSRPCTT